MQKNDEWKTSEYRAAEIYGKRIPGSGSKYFNKLDVDGEGNFNQFRIENKFSKNRNSFTLNLKKLKEAEKKALILHNKQALWRIDFDGNVYIVMPERVFINNFED